jgi:hypothetical protein
MFKVLGALVATYLEHFYDRAVQVELVMSDRDWHYHLGFYERGTAPERSNVLLAMD